MPITLDLHPEVDARLVQQAGTAQLPFSEYVNHLFESLVIPKEVDLSAFLSEFNNRTCDKKYLSQYKV